MFCARKIQTAGTHTKSYLLNFCCFKTFRDGFCMEFGWICFDNCQMLWAMQSEAMERPHWLTLTISLTLAPSKVFHTYFGSHFFMTRSRSLYLISIRPLPHCLRSFLSPCLRPLVTMSHIKSWDPAQIDPHPAFHTLVSWIGNIIFQVLRNWTKAVTNGHSILYNYTISPSRFDL